MTSQQLLETVLADATNLPRDLDTAPLRRLLGRLLSVAPDDSRERLWHGASARVGYCPPNPTLDALHGPLAARAFVEARGLPDATDRLASTVPLARWVEAIGAARPDLAAVWELEAEDAVMALTRALERGGAFADCNGGHVPARHLHVSFPPEAVLLALTPGGERTEQRLVRALQQAASATPPLACAARRVLETVATVLDLHAVDGTPKGRARAWGLLDAAPLLLSIAVERDAALRRAGQRPNGAWLFEQAWQLSPAARRHVADGGLSSDGIDLFDGSVVALLATTDLDAATLLTEDVRASITWTDPFDLDAVLAAGEREALDAIAARFDMRPAAACLLDDAVLLRDGKPAQALDLGTLARELDLPPWTLVEGLRCVRSAVAVRASRPADPIDSDMNQEALVGLVLGPNEDDVRRRSSAAWIFRPLRLPTCEHTRRLVDEGTETDPATGALRLGPGFGPLLAGTPGLLQQWAARLLALVDHLDPNDAWFEAVEPVVCILAEDRPAPIEPPLRDLVVRYATYLLDRRWNAWPADENSDAATPPCFALTGGPRMPMIVDALRVLVRGAPRLSGSERELAREVVARLERNAVTSDPADHALELLAGLVALELPGALEALVAVAKKRRGGCRCCGR